MDAEMKMNGTPNPTPDAMEQGNNLTPEAKIGRLYALLQSYERQAKAGKAGRQIVGLNLGKQLYDLRAQAEVVQGGTTFDSTMKTLEIPRRTAYNWIKRYKVSAGLHVPAAPAPAACIGLDLWSPRDKQTRKLAQRMCRAATRMCLLTFDLANGGQNADKSEQWASGCRTREELAEMVSNLQRVKRALDTTLPIVESMLEATDQEKKSRATWDALPEDERRRRAAGLDAEQAIPATVN